MRVVFRCDASLSIGTGHVMRCMALALALQERGARVLFLCREIPAKLRSRLNDSGIEVRIMQPSNNGAAEDLGAPLMHQHWLQVPQAQDAIDTIATLQPQVKIDLLVVDHYALDARWECAMRSFVQRILVIDDLADRDHDCDILLDQNFRKDAAKLYKDRLPQAAVRLIGPRYALLRADFARERERARGPADDLHRMLLFFGGFDTGNYTSRALEAVRIAGLPRVAVDVVVGAGHPHLDEIDQICRSRPRHTLHIDTQNMASLSARADIAIGAGGATQWERCCMGLPSIVMSVAENQYPIALDLAQEGACVFLGRASEVSVEKLAASIRGMDAMPSIRHAISRRAASLVDGEGARRVAHRLVPELVSLRAAVVADCESIFTWRNAEQNRWFSGDPAPIPYARHHTWFEGTLADPKKRLLIGEHNHESIGVLRYDLGSDSATVSVYLVPGFHGKGLGAALLLAGNKWLQQHYPDMHRIAAEVRVDNLASLHAFENAGFHRHSELLVRELNHDHE